MKLHLGCGKHILPDWVNVDKIPSTQNWEKNPKLVRLIKNVDLRKPWPWPNDSVSLITLSHLLYCMTDDERRFVISECFRVLQKTGIVRITEDDNDNPASKYHKRLHHNAVTRQSLGRTYAMMASAGFTVHGWPYDKTLAKDDFILLDMHGHGPEIFFLEGVKS